MISGLSKNILVVDDSATHRVLHQEVLAKDYSVVAVPSGEEALLRCRASLPDLVLLDLEMPGMSGLDVCRELREYTDIPVIVVTANQNPEDHLLVYDAGADDIVTKPISRAILLRKVRQALQRHEEMLHLKSEKSRLETMAMHFLSSFGESGTLLDFMRAGALCRSHEQLADEVLKAIGSYGVWCSLMLRTDGGTTIRTTSGAPSELETSVLMKLSLMGRTFEFKNRFVVNYDHITIILNGMPLDDSDKAGRIRDNVTIIAESAEALSDIVTLRQQFGSRAEQLQLALGEAVSHVNKLQERHNQLITDVHLRLQQFIDKVEGTYSYLDTTPDQEATISETMHDGTDDIMKLLSGVTSADQQDFMAILDVLRGPSAPTDMELF